MRDDAFVRVRLSILEGNVDEVAATTVAPARGRVAVCRSRRRKPADNRKRAPSDGGVRKKRANSEPQTTSVWDAAEGVGLTLWYRGSVAGP